VTDEADTASLDRLIDCWSSWDTAGQFYLNELAPAIVAGRIDGLTRRELDAVTALRTTLSPEQWQRLPELLQQRQIAHEAERRRIEDQARRAPAVEKERRARERAEREASRAAEAARRAPRRSGLVKPNGNGISRRNAALKSSDADASRRCVAGSSHSSRPTSSTRTGRWRPMRMLSLSPVLSINR
jgi:hypothetical protein